MTAPPLGPAGILRLGLVQCALGGLVMISTSMLNRVMVVEYALPAVLPAALIAWHYGVQLSRPAWGHASDRGGRRKPWIAGGTGMLALGSLLATNAVFLSQFALVPALVVMVLAFTMIGGGVGAAGTSLLALLASRVEPARRPAAAATTWILMVVGIAATAGVSSQFLDPFSPQRLALVAGGVALGAFLLTLAAIAGVREGAAAPEPDAAPPSFGRALQDAWADAPVRRFTIFVFVAMVAYSVQDVILEPFAGHVFAYTPGQSTALSGQQHAGVLVGMLLVGVFGRRLATLLPGGLRTLVVLGCLVSGSALALLALGAGVPQAFPLAPVVMLLGFGNGVFAVSAIAGMMDLAGFGGQGREGIRMGLWGAAQAVAFGLGGLAGAAGVDAGRAVIGADAPAYAVVFAAEALLFLGAAGLALGVRMPGDRTPAARPPSLGVAA
ncbi:MAG: BCD family MFS transporter [Sphingomonadaceae bacterium]|uniref:BCD family MFS transporter n=1 Tax=Thermaurantiacus sp. TaxID=2820283 RepID=UPI00298F10E5|nr:BCD family MFS transporter [Thermaurantiacus sp.]MCS6987795.1 BCD family MFS transporter [Sphingomonadaceae bacterium]MDW8414985.1 BCD family MFS transporter [Thermaurantiacus sp.]